MGGGAELLLPCNVPLSANVELHNKKVEVQVRGNYHVIQACGNPFVEGILRHSKGSKFADSLLIRLSK